MRDEQAPIAGLTVEEDPLAVSARRSGRAWRALGQRIASITPSRLARLLLFIAAVIVILWLFLHTWFALLPFTVGLVFVYITLPLVNRLARVLPRPIVSLGVLLLGIALFVLLIVTAVPVLAREVNRLIGTLPGVDDVRARVDDLRAFIRTLPPEQQQVVLDAADNAANTVRDNIALYLKQFVRVLLVSVFSLAGAVSFFLGFLIVPLWAFTVLNDQPSGVRLLNRLLPEWLRGDFWAVFRIFDRTFGPYLRGQILIAASVGIMLFAALYALSFSLAGVGLQYPLLLALFAGFAELIPVIGWLLGTIPAVLLGFSVSPRLGLELLAIYLVVQFVKGQFVVSRVSKRSVDIHPAVLATAIVAASQFGPIWLIIAPPLVVSLRDLYRYAYGRVSDPPVPAGTLPQWGRARTRVTSATPAAVAPQRAPAEYRRRL